MPPRRLTVATALVVVLTAGAVPLAAVPLAAHESERTQSPASPAPARQRTGAQAVATIRAFYAYHFAHGMAFTASGVRRRAAWLAPDLLALCRAHFARPGSPDEVPAIDGDAFTDSQEYPRAFHVGSPLLSASRPVPADTLLVPVTFLWPGAKRRTVTVVMVPVGSTWRIADVRYPEGTSLRELLAPDR